MKTLSILICLIIGIELSLSQSSDDSLHTIMSTDSAITKQDTIIIKEDQRRLAVTVNPKEASDASITIIRKSRFYNNPYGGGVESQIGPDTIGVWAAPIALPLSFGKYDFMIKKEGFKDILQTININKRQKDSIAIEMSSLEYIYNKQKQWRTIKWINAGVAAIAGVAMYYFNYRINTYKNEYDNSISLDFIKDRRDRINHNRIYYKLSSAVGVIGVCGFVLSWQIEEWY